MMTDAASSLTRRSALFAAFGSLLQTGTLFAGVAHERPRGARAERIRERQCDADSGAVGHDASSGSIRRPWQSKTVVFGIGISPLGSELINRAAPTIRC